MTRVKLTKALSELKLQNLVTTQPWGIICDAEFRNLFDEWGVDSKKLIAVEDVDRLIDSDKLPKILLVCTESPKA